MTIDTTNWKTSLAGLLAVLAIVVPYTPLGTSYPGLSDFLTKVAIAWAGFVAKDFTTHSTQAEVTKSTEIVAARKAGV